MALRRFFVCPVCREEREAGYTGLWVRWDLTEVWLMDGTVRVHSHSEGDLPNPEIMWSAW